MLLSGSRRVVFTLRPMAIASPVSVAGGSRALAGTAPSGGAVSRDFSEKRSVPSVAVRATGSLKETSGLLGLSAKRSLYSAGRSISGTKAGLDSLFPGGQRSSLLKRAWPSVSTVRCEATVAEKEAAPVEKFEYQAEVTRLLDLIVHSLYSHKEVFLRELVSNASDALDKLRFLSVTEPNLLEANTDLEIRIQTDAENGTITISDTGVGMTRDELVRSLGTIAESGTAKFLKALKDNKENPNPDNNLIGQFGVGFYSAFLVADKVSVSTKSAKSSQQYVWEGEADTSVYTIREETDPEKMIPRGSAITLYLKTDAKDEYTDPQRIQNLVKNYSQFISFPIYTYQEKTRTTEVEDEEAAPAEGDDAEAAKKKKKTTEKYWDWELANETKPLWLRSPKDVAKADYNGFFKTTFGDFMDPMAYTHFSTEGEIEFKSLLYIPGMAPFNTDDIMSQKSKNIKLYVKRVFISDEFDGELFPRYLGFVKGVVDSNDLPLNVSREILQESRIVRIMKKRLVRKTFDMINEIAKREDKKDYKLFWTNFGKNMKLGCIEDTASHKKLAPLLRFFSSKTDEDELCTLDEYVDRMKATQTSIYYLAADTVKSAKSAPFLEELSKRDLEVLFLIDPIDEVAITNLSSYKDKKFVDVSKEDLDLDTEDKEKEKEQEAEYKLLCDWMKGFLGDKVAKVKVSNRISSSPCVLVSGKFGWSANMERIMKAQTLGDNTQLEFMRGRRVLEINPSHPIIMDLNFACKETPRSPKAKHLVELLYETAQLSSGFSPENPAEFGGRVYEMMAMALAGNKDAVMSQKEDPASAEVVEANPPEEGETEVVEASEVRPESDPWKQ
jgi:heat shock protein beta